MIKIRSAYLFLFISVLLADVTTRQGENCTEGWVKLSDPGHCYLFSSELHTWFEAKKTCNSKKSKLVETDNEEENNLIVSVMRNNNTGAIWTGGTDYPRVGVWLWMSTKSVIGPYTNWSTGNPSDNNESDHCLEIQPDFNYEWNDNDCYVQNRFVCEERLEKKVNTSMTR